MTKVMICGSRRAEDIQLLIEAGVDGIGLITEVWQEIACNLSWEELSEKYEHWKKAHSLKGSK